MASIRAAGGKSKLKNVKESKSGKKSKDRMDTLDDSGSGGGGGGGDLMGDLMKKLCMRRRGISGNTSKPVSNKEKDPPSTNGGGNVMDKISAMIPPPIPKIDEDDFDSDFD